MEPGTVDPTARGPCRTCVRAIPKPSAMMTEVVFVLDRFGGERSFS